MRTTLLALLLLATFSRTVLALEVSEAWMRALPPGQPTAAAYMTVSNPSGQAVSIVAVSSSLARSVEIHESRQVDGMWRMRRLPQLEIAPGGALSLAPGGAHLMLFGLTSAPREGDQVEFQLTLGSGEIVAVSATVRPINATGSQHQHH